MPQPKRSNATVVLEVAPRAAKVLTASTSTAQAQIQRLNASTLAEQTDDPVTALRALLAIQPIGAREVGLLFGREAFSLRTLELPSTVPKEIASMLELQLGKLTPYPRADIISAWTVIGSFRDGYTTVLLAIARKALIQGVLQFLKTKGITPLWVGVSTEGLEAWWAVYARQAPKLPDGQLHAVIDVDFASTDCAILSSAGQLLFTHSIATGYDQLTTSDQAKLRWVGELVRLPRILLHEEVKGQIGRGVMTGVTAGLEPLVEQLATQWGVAVELAETLKPFAPSSSVAQAAQVTHVSYAALAGLVAIGKPPRIDLIPQEARVSQALRVRSTHLARLAGSLAAVLVLAIVLCLERIVILSGYLKELKQRLATIEQTSQVVMQRQERMAQIRDWLNPSGGPLELFNAVAAAAGPELTITQLSYSGLDDVKIRGTAQAVQLPYGFVDRLKQQGPFGAGQSCYVANNKATGSKGAEFEVVCGRSKS